MTLGMILFSSACFPSVAIFLKMSTFRKGKFYRKKVFCTNQNGSVVSSLWLSATRKVRKDYGCQRRKILPTK